MASLVLTGDTSGQVTLAAPAVAGTTTLTLPATTGTVLNDATVGVCRAWVNFNGTGTVAIRASFNVTSITDNGVGLYTVNFTNAMPDTNYATVGTCNFEVDVGLPFNSRTAATGSVGVETYRPYPYNTAVDVSTVSVSIFR
jgi:hypothetical protein